MKYGAVLLLLLSNVIFSSNLAHSANYPWVESYISGQTSLANRTQLLALPDVFDCGEQEFVEYCAFDVNYRGVDVDIRFVTKDDKVIESIITVPFTTHAYSQLQTNLRVDGYQLAEVKMGSVSFNIKEQIELHGMLTADQKLIKFLNSAPIQESKLFTWVRKNEIQNMLATETLSMTSDGTDIVMLLSTAQ
jgi:hypothetical protein